MGDEPRGARRVFRAAAEGAAEIVEPAGGAPDAGGLTPMTFSTHVLSLNALGQVHLGLDLGGLDVGEAGAGRVDLEGARHVIDILEMLQRKTAGNLTSEETRLLDSVLYELRLLFVERKGVGPKG